MVAVMVVVLVVTLVKKRYGDEGVGGGGDEYGVNVCGGGDDGSNGCGYCKKDERDRKCVL